VVNPDRHEAVQFVFGSARRTADVPQRQNWIAISLTNSTCRRIFGSRKWPFRELPYEIECQASDRRDAQAHDAALLLCGDRSLSLIFS
jgi:hypothetical protein